MSTIYEAADLIADKADLGATGLVAFVISANGSVDVIYGSQNGSQSHEQMLWYLEEAHAASELLLEEK